MNPLGILVYGQRHSSRLPGKEAIGDEPAISQTIMD